MLIPVGDSLRVRTTPFVNWSLIVANFLVFFYILGLGTRPDLLLAGRATSEVDRFFFDWGFTPSCLAEYVGVNSDVSARVLRAICPPGDRELLQPFTSMFLHAGWAHILSNMLFLWIFGDNVEDAMGHARYLLFYVLCGLAAAFAQTALTITAGGDLTTPAVGASGAIAGVLAAYLMMYPRAMIQVVLLPLFFLPLFVPALFLIGLWFLTQLFAGLQSTGAATVGSGVAWWAHVGGFLAGAVLVWFFRVRTRTVRTFGGWPS